MEIIQTVIGKLINKMSVGLLILFLSAIYFVWTAGLGNAQALFLYDNSAQFVTFGIVILFILNVYKGRRADFIFLAAAMLIYFLFDHFREVRASSMNVDLLIPLIIVFCLTVKWIQFDKLDRSIFILVCYVFLGITLYRIFTEIKIPNGESIWLPDNKVSDIWINTNTIGSTLMTLSLLISGFASSFERWYVRVFVGFPSVIAGIIGIWVCQSKGALVAMIVFVLLDIWPKQLFKIIRAPFLAYMIVTIFALPVSYLAAHSEHLNLFTGREEIWLKFYETISEKSEQVWVGMKPFIFQRGNQFLGNHNSYNSFLNLYGLLGVIIAGVLVLIYVGRLTLKADLSNGQVTFLWAFFAVMIQSFMEDTLTSFPWVPIIYLLLGMASHRYDDLKNVASKRKIANQQTRETTDGSLSRVARRH
ncbi:MAG: EpaQ family protein [Enterococcus hirae]|nr:EpaQ family protein [Enterococcus hirae]